MRISSTQFQQQAINSMLEQQGKLSQVQQQVATGRRLVKPSDDPVAASKIIKLNDILRNAEQFQANITNARARLTVEEGVLSNVSDAYHRMRELTIQANNDSQSGETRQFIAAEMEQLLEEVLGLANSTDGNGEFIFSGNKVQFKPFSRNNEGGFDYHGDDGQRLVQIGPRRQIAVNDSGSDVFREITDGNSKITSFPGRENKGDAVIDPGAAGSGYDGGTYAIVVEKQDSLNPDAPLTYRVVDSQGNVVVPPGQLFETDKTISFRGIETFVRGQAESGDYFVIRPSYHQDVFTSIKEYIDQLRDGQGTPDSHGQFHNHTNRFLNAIDKALGQVLETRANVGARMNAMDSQENINDALKIQIREILSEVEDLDYGEAVSKLNLKLTGLQASQKAFTRVQDISLFDYL